MSKKTKKVGTDVLVVMVADKSGSMSPVINEVKKGFNDLVKEQAALDEGTCYVSLVTLGGSGVEAPFGTREASEIPRLGSNFRASGGTPLYDGIGVGIEGADAWIEANDFTGEVVLMIWTDGGECTSRHFTLEAVNAMIADRQELGWNCQFMGSGEEAWRTAESFSVIPKGNFVMADTAGATYTANYASMSATLGNVRSSGVYNFSGVESGVTS